MTGSKIENVKNLEQGHLAANFEQFHFLSQSDLRTKSFTCFAGKGIVGLGGETHLIFNITVLSYRL